MSAVPHDCGCATCKEQRYQLGQLRDEVERLTAVHETTETEEVLKAATAEFKKWPEWKKEEARRETDAPEPEEEP